MQFRPLKKAIAFHFDPKLRQRPAKPSVKRWVPPLNPYRDVPSLLFPRSRRERLRDNIETAANRAMETDDDRAAEIALDDQVNFQRMDLALDLLDGKSNSFTSNFDGSSSGPSTDHLGNEAMSGNGSDYQGRQLVAKSGRVCQPWSQQNQHQNLPENFCRNPDDSETIFCMTDQGKEFCEPLRLLS